MFGRIIVSATAIAGLVAAAPAWAQDEPEEARTTYSVTLLKVAPGKDDRFAELEETYGNPAREAAGMPQRQLHWAMGGEYDFIIVTEMPDGLSVLDTHSNPKGEAFRAKIVELAGSEEAAKEVTAEYQGMIVESNTIYTHTHP